MNEAAGSVARYLLEGKDPDRIALRFSGEDLRYGELTRRVFGMARRLREAGARPGDRVLLLDDNSPFWVAAYLGTQAAGCVSVPLPPNLPEADFAHVVGSTRPRLVLAAPACARRLGGDVGDASLLTPNDLEAGTDMSPASFGADPDPDALAALMFTSGSSGRPRGVMVSHRNIRANTESIISSLRLTARDRVMAVLPFHYCFGTSLLHTHLRVGGSLVVDRRFMYPEAILERMVETRCTGFAGVPSHFQILPRSSGLAEKSFPDLRYVQQAGGRLPPSDVEALGRALPGTDIFLMYGQTEATARLSCLDPESVAARPGSVGKAIPGVRLRLIDVEGQEVSPGAAGEIVASGENVTSGYWEDPEGTSAVFRDGALHTGDIATADEEGFIYVVDRAGDFLKIGGERIACRQIEDQLAECAEVREAAVVAIPDPILGEAVRAFVVPAPGAMADGLAERIREFCSQRRPRHLVPAEIVVLDRLPRNDAGKLARAVLRAFDPATRSSPSGRSGPE
jgi:acyl-CoA synthetase (AMP-forming)/AMP-acid ligase II